MDRTLINSYAEYLREMGYSELTIRNYSKVLEHAPDTWNTNVPQELYEHINSALNSEQESFSSASRRNIRPASSLLFMMATGIAFRSYAKQATLRQTSYADILHEFYVYSTQFKHMTDMAAEAENHHVSEFLSTLDGVPSDWTEITAENLRDYIRSKFSGLKPSSIGRYVTSLRNFFRFLEYKGNTVNLSVLSLPLAPAAWGKSNVPVILSPEEEIRLRNHYKAGDEVSRRNNIVVLLMLDLGLRCSEVSDLCMMDIHWNSGIIHLGKTKNQHDRELPISHELGKLLEDYVIKHRPHTTDEHLLLRKVRGNQYAAMSRERVRGVVRQAFKKENIQGWWKGTHALRRTAASKIYNTGNSLKLTADVLGHESLDSAKQYVKVDFRQLREAASPWPGGGSDD